MSIHDTGKGVPEGVKDFRVPTDLDKEPSEFKHIPGDEYADQFGAIGDEEFEAARNFGWIDEQNRLTERGVVQLEKRKPKSPEKSKYAIGDAYKNWWGRENDPLNDEFGDAKEKGWLDDKNCLTEAGVEELLRFDVAKKTGSQVDSTGAAKIAQNRRAAERPVFKISHFAGPTAKSEPKLSAEEKLDAVHRKIAAMDAKIEPETEAQVLDLFDQALMVRGFKVHESNVETTGTSPLGKPLYIFDVTMSRTGRHGKQKPMSRTYEGSKDTILEKIGTLR